MSTLDLRRITLGVGEALERDELIALEPIRLAGHEFVLDPSPVPARVTLTRATTGMVFNLTFSATLRGPCMRCLGAAVTPVAVDAIEYEALDAGDDPDELENPYLDDDVLDLSTWARDSMILAMPDKILCAADCAGLCPSCGRNLAEGACDCAPPPPDTRWAKLEALRSELSG